MTFSYLCCWVQIKTVIAVPWQAVPFQGFFPIFPFLSSSKQGRIFPQYHYKTFINNNVFLIVSGVFQVTFTASESDLTQSYMVSLERRKSKSLLNLLWLQQCLQWLFRKAVPSVLRWRGVCAGAPEPRCILQLSLLPSTSCFNAVLSKRHSCNWTFSFGWSGILQCVIPLHNSHKAKLEKLLCMFIKINYS